MSSDNDPPGQGGPPGPPPGPGQPAQPAQPDDRGSRRTLPPPHRSGAPAPFVPRTQPTTQSPPSRAQPTTPSPPPAAKQPAQIVPEPAPFVPPDEAPTARGGPSGAPASLMTTTRGNPPPTSPAPGKQPATVVPTPSPHSSTLLSFPQGPQAGPTSAPRPMSPSSPPHAPSAIPHVHSGPTGVPQPLSGPTGVPQALSGPATQPSAFPPSGAVPQPSGATNLPLPPPPPSGPIPNYSSQPITSPYGSGPTHGAVAQPLGGPPSGPSIGLSASGLHADVRVEGPRIDLDELPGSEFVKFLKLSLRRAFRLRIEPSEVLAHERATLESANPPILDQNLQAFLAWRRSVLFVVACALIPLSIIGIISALRVTDWKGIFFVKFTPAAAEAVFLWVCWAQLKQWANWRQQRRKLFYGWLLFMLTPFVVFIYPLNSFFEEVRGAVSSQEKRMMLMALGVDGIYKQAVMPFVFSMIAMLQLAPKAISLMPGLIRSSMVIKLLFPGVSAPGWLIVMASPLYALLAYVILVIPYQFTGSGWFIAGILGVVAGQAVLARAGFALARPMTADEAMVQIKKVRRYYMTVMILSAVLIIVALGSLVVKLNLAWTDVITAVLKFEANVLILTMIGADLVVTNLDKARKYTHGRDDVEDATEHKIAAFVSFEAPPPPRDPAP
ncbi:MAG: hypothetical protein ACKV2T_32605 [Kofleriaceae bacterium]